MCWVPPLQEGLDLVLEVKDDAYTAIEAAEVVCHNGEGEPVAQGPSVFVVSFAIKGGVW